MITQIRPFLVGIFSFFLFSWIGFIALPWIEVGHLHPLKNDDVLAPWDTSGLAHAGEKVYAANGCVYCHTQQVRDITAGADCIRGWGNPSKDADGKDITRRRTYPRDYIWQHTVFLGNARIGADLSNVGARFTDAQALYLYLYNPYEKSATSSMPAYRFLFTLHKISGQPSRDALPLSSDLTPAPGYEIIPTLEARQLVAYLLSLNKNYHLPPDEQQGPAQPEPAE